MFSAATVHCPLLYFQNDSNLDVYEKILNTGCGTCKTKRAEEEQT
jgi:hypothetical protein